MTLRSKGFEIEKPSTNLRYLKPKGFPDWCSGNPLPISLKKKRPEHVQRPTHLPAACIASFSFSGCHIPKFVLTSKMENSEARNRFGGEKWKANPLTLEHTETGKIAWIWPRTLLIMFSSNMHWECLAFPFGAGSPKSLSPRPAKHDSICIYPTSSETSSGIWTGRLPRIRIGYPEPEFGMC